MSLRQFIASRKFLRPLSFLQETATNSWNEIASLFGLDDDVFFNPLHRKIESPVKVILIGAGHRGNIYASYMLEYPEEMKIVAVADASLSRRKQAAEEYTIPDQYCFSDWSEIFKRPKFADAVIIATPDQLHTQPCLAALEAGYDVLLEKPIAPTEEECRQILQKAKETGRIVGVCHVLRYSPYFRELKQVIDAGLIGNIISIQHMEPIEHIHMSHSYVRGKWRNSKKATPIILAKSSHDTDIIRWLVNSPVHDVHCFGNLSWFTNRNAPKGSTERCTDGCAVEGTCPYSAIQIYYRDRKRLYVFDPPAEEDDWGEHILEQLKTTDYGRCVYKMDNDQPDHLTVNMLFENGVTAAFSMEAHVSYEGRRTRIMGSAGDIMGDMETFVLTDFKTRKQTSWSLKTDPHGGGDHQLVKDWLQAVYQQDKNLLSSSIEVSVESHLMAFAAERSRQQRTIEDVRL
ncbi:MAG: Gfo/Idh/MocA family oxidoreductase [Sediminibacterium sp. Gen4]|jgi:predicted dehydrogenase|uniref:Gfo/Idh/MocA family protein n=1 Tax=unclassified Sediminibacterium TaxID=2635961 RepID=UPI0015BC407B|nr:MULTISPECIES: Gfo/Idh/MocA family oxidoreductase [unclassified Sediminibacterium]MBW0160886.1 Gfo/Idh/MocA family oxidoreductase [Sediminibacterium sp.]MBW0165493.1 Gfo/Idh/MocA family oxidoreductase [Sediminibacterium sp.]NWK65436.1 Gfo/Idh/MocA family oxidoreductase [Sediminibacterium sp. Gen4]